MRSALIRALFLPSVAVLCMVIGGTAAYCSRIVPNPRLVASCQKLLGLASTPSDTLTVLLRDRRCEVVVP